MQYFQPSKMKLVLVYTYPNPIHANVIGALIVEPFRTKEAEIILWLVNLMKKFLPVEVAAATVAHKIPNAAKIRRFLASASPIFCFWIRIVLIYENYSASCRWPWILFSEDRPWLCGLLTQLCVKDNMIPRCWTNTPLYPKLIQYCKLEFQNKEPDNDTCRSNLRLQCRFDLRKFVRIFTLQH